MIFYGLGFRVLHALLLPDPNMTRINGSYGTNWQNRINLSV